MSRCEAPAHACGQGNRRAFRVVPRVDRLPKRGRSNIVHRVAAEEHDRNPIDDLYDRRHHHFDHIASGADIYFHPHHDLHFDDNHDQAAATNDHHDNRATDPRAVAVDGLRAGGNHQSGR